MNRSLESMQEHRLHFRQVVLRRIEFVGAGGERRAGICRDLSLGGAQIETAEPISFGERVTVFLELEGMDAETPLAGVVRWTKPNLMGIQFDLYGVRVTHALLRTLTKAPVGDLKIE